jgi:hypothetical protein
MHFSRSLTLVILCYIITLSSCTQCNVSYAFTYNTTNCVLCNGANQTILNGTCYSTAPNCQINQVNATNPSTLVCIQCNMGYAFAYNTTNCVVCNSSYQVIQNNICYSTPANCQVNQVSSTNPGTLVCGLCIANCAFSYNTTTCTLCNATNQTILNGTCYSTAPNCQVNQVSATNPSTTVCTLCNTNYAFVYNTTSCVQCNATTQTILNGTCYAAPPNCQQYQLNSTTATVFCTQCNVGYAFAYNTTNCTQCNNTGQVIMNSICYAAPANCVQYQVNATNSSTLLCTQCYADYAFIYGTSYCVACNGSYQVIQNSTCFNSTPNCLQYQVSSTNPGALVCTQCNVGYAFTYNTTNCVVCNGSYQVIQNSICYAVPANCQYYQVNSANPSTLVCTLCIANYAFVYNTTNCTLCSATNQVLVNSTCYIAIPNCQVNQVNATNPSTLVCIQCNTNYAFVYNTTNCVQCNTTTQTILNNTCYAAPANCQYQISSTNPSTMVCVVCNANYAFTYNTTNCIICNDSNLVILNNICYAVPVNCQYQMSSTNLGTLVCTQCNTNYAFVYNTTNCVQCNTTTQTILNNTCYAAPANCQYQISSTNPSTMVCVVCNANYAFTYNTTNCIICNAAGQSILNNTCYTGVSNCAQY